MIDPQKPEFEFRANNADSFDQSGIATWRYSEWDKGEWKRTIIQVKMASFTQAMWVNGMLRATWNAGEAAGWANLQGKILDAMK